MRLQMTVVDALDCTSNPIRRAQCVYQLTATPHPRPATSASSPPAEVSSASNGQPPSAPTILTLTDRSQLRKDGDTEFTLLAKADEHGAMGSAAQSRYVFVCPDWLIRCGMSAESASSHIKSFREKVRRRSSDKAISIKSRTDISKLRSCCPAVPGGATSVLLYPLKICEDTLQAPPFATAVRIPSRAAAITAETDGSSASVSVAAVAAAVPFALNAAAAAVSIPAAAAAASACLSAHMPSMEREEKKDEYTDHGTMEWCASNDVATMSIPSAAAAAASACSPRSLPSMEDDERKDGKSGIWMVEGREPFIVDFTLLGVDVDPAGSSFALAKEDQTPPLQGAASTSAARAPTYFSHCNPNLSDTSFLPHRTFRSFFLDLAWGTVLAEEQPSDQIGPCTFDEATRAGYGWSDFAQGLVRLGLLRCCPHFNSIVPTLRSRTNVNIALPGHKSLLELCIRIREDLCAVGMQGRIESSGVRNWSSLFVSTARVMSFVMHDCATLGDFEVALQRMWQQFPVLRVFVYVFVCFYAAVSQLADSCVRSASEASQSSSSSSSSSSAASSAPLNSLPPRMSSTVPDPRAHPAPISSFRAVSNRAVDHAAAVVATPTVTAATTFGGVGLPSDHVPLLSNAAIAMDDS